MTPIKNQIVFKPLPSEEKSDSGFYIPENARAVNNKGVIVKVGEGTTKNPMRLKEGVIAYRTKDWGEPFFENNELFFLMDENAILATE